MTDEELLARLAAIEQRLTRLEEDVLPIRKFGARLTLPAIDTDEQAQEAIRRGLSRWRREGV